MVEIFIHVNTYILTVKRVLSSNTHVGTHPFHGLQCSQLQCGDVVGRTVTVPSSFCLSGFSELVDTEMNFYESLAITICSFDQ